MKDKQKAIVGRGIERIEGEESSAHLAFRRIVVHDFDEEADAQPVRFQYRVHSKHLPKRRAA